MMQTLTLLSVCLTVAVAQWTPPSYEGRTTIVHLFEWPWSEVAEECEVFLAQYGYAGVQISPPSENVIVNQDNVKRPWWERYQPVSYILETRSGSLEDFKDMVRRCNNVGVRIYSDAVINHMSGYWPTGTQATGGSAFDAGNEKYDGVPYSKLDFNDANCDTPDGGIDNQYNDKNTVRNCKLDGLNDLNQSTDYVCGKIIDYLNVLVDLGVAGFRVDAAKHMWPQDLQVIFDGINDLNTDHGFPIHSRPFIYQEVHEADLEPIKVSDYFKIGRVTEFKLAAHMKELFTGTDQLKWLYNFGEDWAMMPSDDALVFIDNHDTQRDGSTLTYKQARAYKMATAFELAWPYGQPKVISSFSFDDRDQGPPHDSDYNILPVIRNSDLTCGNGWVCEHRWRQIYNMAHFRNVAKGEPVAQWWDNGNNQISFCRGNKSFLAINNDNYELQKRLQTCLAAGEYCDVISGNLEGDRCSGTTISVSSDGTADIRISHDAEDPMIALHEQAKIEQIPNSKSDDENNNNHPSYSSVQQTVIFLHRTSSFGENVYVNGGLDDSLMAGIVCENSSDDPCAIRIQHRTHTHVSAAYDAWKVDNLLQWFGAEPGQGNYCGVASDGSPMIWTTNVSTNNNYDPRNKWGPDYWMLDVDMNCNDTVNGWFAFKGVIDNQWESDIPQELCGGSVSSYSPANTSKNHLARCGYINIFDWNDASCEIEVTDFY